jgi:CIC family chloride channel protein
VKALASALTISSGGSAGPEGPIVQIGAAIASSIGQFLHLSPRRLRTLSACGAGAGIAAVFNAPVAGALFAVEVILGDFGVPQFSPIVISSVVATVVSRHHLGDTSELGRVHYALNTPVELLGYVVLGVLAAFVSVAFMRMLAWSEHRIAAIGLPVVAKGALGGLLVGLIGLQGPGLMGVGYDTMNHTLKLGQDGAVTLGAGVLALLLVGKAITVRPMPPEAPTTTTLIPAPNESSGIASPRRNKRSCQPCAASRYHPEVAGRPLNGPHTSLVIQPP